jgi:hypothetical protein
MRVWPLLLPLLHPTTPLSRAALSVLRLSVLLSVRCPPQPFIIIHLGAELALAGWAEAIKVIHLHTTHHRHGSPTKPGRCLHARTHALVLYYCRRRGSSCIMPTPPITPVYSCYECRRAEWPPDALRFGGTDKGRQAIIISPNISFVDTASFFCFHPSIHLLFLLLSCSTIHLLSSC